MANTQLKKELAETLAEVRKAVAAKNAAGAPIDSKAMEEAINKRMAQERQRILSEARLGDFRMDQSDRNPQELVVAKSNSAEVKEFQKWNDDVLLTATLLRKHPSTLKIFQKRVAEFRGVSELKKAMDTSTANEGTDWIPTDFSSDLIDRVRLATLVPGLFPEIQMPTPTYKLPAVKEDGAVYLVSENTADSGQSEPTASTPKTRNVTLTATKLGSAVRISTELEEDSIVPALDFIKNNMATAWANALEDAVINGDTTATHQDADVTSSADHRKAWKGLRKHSIAASDVSLTAVPTIAELRSMRSKMGVYGRDVEKLVFIASLKGYMKLLSVAEFLTVDKYGPNATVLSGELGKIDGIRVIVSGKMRDDLNASGVNDSTTNTKGLLLLVYVPAFIRGIRRRMTSWSDYEGKFDQTVLVSFMRADFQPVYVTTTENVVVKGVNWAV